MRPRCVALEKLRVAQCRTVNPARASMAHEDRDVMTNNEQRRIRRVYGRRDESPVVRRRNDVSNSGRAFELRERNEQLLLLLGPRLRSLDSSRILDVGCGVGWLLAWFRNLGVPAENLVGVDLVAHRVAAARRRYPDLTFQVGDAAELDFPAASFDIVTLFTVMSSILDRRMRVRVADSVSRVLAPGGAIIWYDMRYSNPWNRDIRGITRKDLEALFPRFVLELRRTTLLPPLARRLGPLTDFAYPLLEGIPALDSHYLGLLSRAARPDSNDLGRRRP
ncbi:MAG: class I SAM-dependent methyltransferase [Actinomycetota bacterium]